MLRNYNSAKYGDKNGGFVLYDLLALSCNAIAHDTLLLHNHQNSWQFIIMLIRY